MSEKSILEMVGGEKHINPHYNIKAEKTDKDEMNEEELFCKLFPEYTVNGKPLSPYFDLFESGYEQAENRIEELERKLKVETELSNRLGLAYREYEQLTKEQDEHLAEFEQENAELKSIIQNTKAVDESFARQTVQLTKAKEIIREFMKYEINEYDGSLEIHFEELKKQAEQFLNSEVEK